MQTSRKPLCVTLKLQKHNAVQNKKENFKQTKNLQREEQRKGTHGAAPTPLPPETGLRRQKKTCQKFNNKTPMNKQILSIPSFRVVVWAFQEKK